MNKGTTARKPRSSKRDQVLLAPIKAGLELIQAREDLKLAEKSLDQSIPALGQYNLGSEFRFFYDIVKHDEPGGKFENKVVEIICSEYDSQSEREMALRALIPSAIRGKSKKLVKRIMNKVRNKA